MARHAPDIEDCPPDVLTEVRMRRAFNRALRAHSHHLDPERPDPEEYGLATANDQGDDE